MQSRTAEIWVGIFVALGLAALAILSMSVSNLNSLYEGETYQVKAYFSNVGGLKTKSPVTMAGVKIGRVAEIQFDPDRFEAEVTLSINTDYSKIPEDTSAGIYTSGLLGEQYIGLEPGAEDLYLEEGSTLMITQSAVVLEKLIGQFLYQTAEGD
ncbi:MAG: outer membrane lipid asymmetry maintenance protein MlaD [Pseudomonadota bacterium]